MEVFKSKGPRMIYVPRLGMRIRFDENGEYHTDNEDEIKALRRNRNIIQSKDDGESQVTSKEAPDVTHEVVHEDAEDEPVVEDEPESEDDEVDEVDEEEDEEVDPDVYTRAVLDGMAEAEGLDPSDYANKGEVAEAINAARAQ